MVSEKNFKISVEHDGSGLMVSILHLPTGLERSACPLPGVPVHAVQTKLMYELRRQFYDENEFRWDIGCCEDRVSGKRGSFMQIIHMPTGKSKLIVPMGNRSSREVRVELIDLLVAELWQEGIRPFAEQ